MDAYDKVERQCEEEGIIFRRAKSHLDVKESWKLFGPPSRTLRWCCSVHKSTPQTLEVRKLTEKNDYVGLDFVGVRAQESLKRSEYKYENFGIKQQGQYSHNSILEWTSAEIWLYTFANGLSINDTYKKGNSRAGCLFCPMSGGISDYMRRSSYSDEIDEYVEIIKRSNSWDAHDKSAAETYITNTAWATRRSGRGIAGNYLHYMETCENGVLSIEVIDPASDWREWIKTVGEASITEETVFLVAENTSLSIDFSATSDGYMVRVPDVFMKEHPTFARLFRQVFRKAAYCKGCRVCETNCRNGCISFDNNGSVRITNCSRCHECHSSPYGCLLFDSMKIPQGEKRMKSLNCFDDHAPKLGWLTAFFKNRDNFFVENDLGPNMLTKFKRFLKDASLMDKNHFTSFAERILHMGWESDTAWGLIITNLAAENPQIQWYIKNLEIGRVYSRKVAESMLTAINVKEKDARSIVKSFKRLVETPLGTKLNFGYVTEEGDLCRTSCAVSDPRVVLYALYKFSEKCGGYREFRLSRLLDYSIDSDGISPTQIFGLNRVEMEPILIGLTAKYPQFVNATFTGDLDKISLRDEKTSDDVLRLL